MLQRVFIHLSLILLFAFTQMGVATHAISHFADSHEHHQQEQNHHENQCGQCIGLNHISDANTATLFNFTLGSADHIFSTCIVASANTKTPLLYTARSPPVTSQA